jgi:hypothetical protein
MERALTDDGVGAGRLLSRGAHRLLDGFKQEVHMSIKKVHG